MTVRIHFVDSHLDFFQKNLGSATEKRYQRKWSSSLIADYWKENQLPYKATLSYGKKTVGD